MLVKTDETQSKLLPFEKREETLDQIRQWIEQETANAMYLEDPDTSPIIVGKRLGRPLLPAELERKLVKICPTLVFEVNPNNSRMKALYNVDSRGKEYICAYHNEVMSERSIMRVKVEEVPETDANGLPIKHFDRKDLGAHELVPGKGFLPKPGVTNPYVKKVLIPYGEKTRGWRTVLIKLVRAGLVTPTAVEREFGADNTPEWQGSMGKSDLQRPW